MGDQQLKAARALLTAGNYDIFFNALSELRHDYDRCQLATEACEVALHKKNAELLQRIATVELAQSSYAYGGLFEAIIRNLVELSQYEKAVFVVFENDGSKLEQGQGWYLLAKALLAKNKFEQVKQAYRHIKTYYRADEIAHACLKKLSLQDNLLEWLFWYDCVTSASVNLSQVVKAIQDFPDFEKVCSALRTLNSANSRALQVRLYVHFFNAGGRDKCMALTKGLPKELAWLTKAQDLFESGQSFDLLPKFGGVELQLIISVAVGSLVRVHVSSSDPVLIEALVQAATAAGSCSREVYCNAVRVCMQQQRVDVAIALLPKIEHQFERETFLLELLQMGELQQSQYEQIICHLGSVITVSSRVAEILALIPTQVVMQARRQEVERLKKDIDDAKIGLAKPVSTKDPDFKLLKDLMSKLLAADDYASALDYCKRMVASNERDFYVMRLFFYALSQSDWSQVASIVKIFCSNETRQNLNNFVADYQIPNYRRAFVSLAKLKNNIEFADLMLLCVERILQEPIKADAVNFLVSNQVFSLPNSASWYGSQNASIKKIKKATAATIELDRSEDKKLMAYVANLMQRNIAGFEIYLFKCLLKKQRFAAAMRLLNASKELSYSAPDIVERYIQKYAVSREFLQALSQLEDESLRDVFIERGFSERCDSPSRETIELMAVIPVEESRNKYLGAAVISCVGNSDVPLARVAISHLPVAARVRLVRVLEYMDNQEFFPLIDYILNEFLGAADLVYPIMQRALEKETIDGLSSKLDIFCERLKKMNPEESYEESVLSDSYYQRRDQALNIFEGIFSCWRRCLLEAELCDVLVEKAFVVVRRHASSFDFQEKSFYTKLLDKLLQKGMVNQARDLCELVSSKGQEQWCVEALIKIADFLYENGSCDDAASILISHSAKREVRNKVREWCFKEIESGRSEKAKKLVDDFLSDEDEPFFIRLIEEFVGQAEVVLAHEYLQREKVATPGSVVRLQSQLEEAYLNKLRGFLGKEIVDELVAFVKKYAESLRLSADANRQSDMSRLRRELVTALRACLDKQFLAFFRAKYAAQQLKDLYFPVVPDLQGKTVVEQLRSYFKNKKLPSFEQDFPELFGYLLLIQPLDVGGSNYLWLRQLYKLANTEKHDKDLPLNPSVDGKPIDMQQFLLQAIDGVVEILLKLANYRMLLAEINQLRLSDYVQIQLSSNATSMAVHGLLPVIDSTSRAAVVLSPAQAMVHNSP